MTYLLNLPCQYLQCTEPVVARPAFCFGCDLVLCRDHLDSHAHRECREICVSRLIISTITLTFRQLMRNGIAPYVPFCGSKGYTDDTV